MKLIALVTAAVLLATVYYLMVMPLLIVITNTLGEL
jgi:hypothetical protein